MGVGSVESHASTCPDVSRGALTDKNAIPRYTKALRESPRRAQSGNRWATHHPAPAAKPDGSEGPELACVTHSASRTATSHKRRRYLVMKGSAVQIRSSAFSQPGEWLGSRLTAAPRRRSRLTATRPFWARAAKRQVASYTDAVASISMRRPGSASPVTPAMVCAGCPAPPVTSSMPLVIASYSVGVVV